MKSEERPTPAKPHPPSPPPLQFDDEGDCGVGDWEGGEGDAGEGGEAVGMKEEVTVVESEEPKPAV